MSRNTLILPSFLKNIFAGYDSYFLSEYLRYPSTVPGFLCCFEKSAVELLWRQCLFFFWLFLRSLAMKYVCNVWIKKKKLKKKKKGPDPSWACVFSLSSTIPIGILISSMSLKSLLAYPTVLFHIASLVLSSNSLIVFYTSLNIISYTQFIVTNPEWWTLSFKPLIYSKIFDSIAIILVVGHICC